MPFITVQNQLYNALVEGLGQSNQTFQLLQPAAPITSDGGDRFLWSFLNNIPPLSIDQNYTQSGGNQLFSDYKGVLSALRPATKVDIKQEIGQENFENFVKYLQSLKPIPPANQFPDVFFNWAMVNAPDVAQQGASAYAAIILDPIGGAQQALMPYMQRPPAPPDWVRGYDALLQDLSQAPRRTFEMRSATTSSDVSRTWSSGRRSVLFGLWRSSESTERLSEYFSQSELTVSASFGHVLNFQTNAGAWYGSSALGTAYTKKGDPPWRSGSAITWDNTFGTSGNIQRVAINLMVADTMEITVTAKTSFSQQDQQTIHGNAGFGLWPFYNGRGEYGMTTNTQFSASGGTTITTASSPGVPVVIGVNVLPIGRFLGYTPAAREQ
ncbi:hypothetical protein ACGFLS_06525 [Streptomyces abikoensis]|uniref:hypothetical protein n=1 Tax=Streptomyces abikoensis TaxID=97398 RepID=UPI00371C2033